MRDIATKAIGSKFYYQDCNSMATELEHMVTTSGQLLSEPDTYQISKAAAIYSSAGNFYIDSGTADHYVLTPVSTRQAPIIYIDGMSVRFRTSNQNTGPADINVAGLGVINIVKEDGFSSLDIGDIPANQVIELVYNESTGYFELYSHKYEDQVFRTGFNLWTDSTGDLSGFVWINDSSKTTIGSALSGSTIRANADCENLFTLYWAYNATDCPIYTDTGVLTTRGASAAADWAANRRMAIPDKFRKVFAAWDSLDAFRKGQTEGGKTQALGSANNGPHTHGISDPGHAHSVSDPTHAHSYGDSNQWGSGSASAFGAQNAGSYSTTANATGIGIYANVTSVTVASSGSGTAFSIMQPTVYTNLYIKL